MSGLSRSVRYLISVGLACAMVAGCQSRSPSAGEKKSSATRPTTRKPLRKPGQGAASRPASRPVATGPAPRIQADRPILDLGQRWSTDPTIKHEFVISNAGQLPLKILGVVSDCSCTTVGPKKVDLAPGQSWKLEVQLEPSHLSAIVSQKVTVISNDPVRPQFDLRIRGLIRYPVKIDPHNGMYFGEIHANDSPEKTLTLTNNTNDLMELKLIKTEGTTFEGRIEPVEPGKKVRLILKAKPPYKTGVNSSLLRFTTGLKPQPTLDVRPQAYLRPRIQATPNPLLIPQPLTDDSIQQVFIRNSGTSDLKILSASSPLAGVKVDASAPPTNKVYTITLRLPKGLVLSGASPLTIMTNDPEFARIEVGMVGQMLVPPPGLEPATQPVPTSGPATTKPKGE
jgi:hypothetical protein